MSVTGNAGDHGEALAYRAADQPTARRAGWRGRRGRHMI
jgi:hypothetical protein